MRFSKNKISEPEINLIPFIDVLLVILIFLMLSTTYSKLTELDLTLPSANSAPHKEKNNQINLLITADGKFYVRGAPVASKDVDSLSKALKDASQGLDNPLIVISADAQTTHQSVVQALEAAQRNSLHQITFATQTQSANKAPSK
jgi:biopolymer transport protein ExbD